MSLQDFLFRFYWHSGCYIFPHFKFFFEFLGKIFVKILEFTRQGTAFLAGGLLDTSKVGYIFIFQVLPTLIFFSALISLLYYLNIIQRIVQGVGWCIRKIFRLSGSEGLTVAGNIFLGMCEAPILVKRYLPSMNRSEMFLVMSVGMATISGGVMAAYIGMLGGDDPTARLQFAKYLISASVMAAPGAIVFSKIINSFKPNRFLISKFLFPEIKQGKTYWTLFPNRRYRRAKILPFRITIG